MVSEAVTTIDVRLADDNTANIVLHFQDPLGYVVEGALFWRRCLPLCSRRELEYRKVRRVGELPPRCHYIRP